MEGALVAAGRFMFDKVAILVELDEKLKAITGIKGKMEKLKDLSTIIDMVIQHVESRPLNKDAVKVLLRNLKYLAYDLEDVVDYYDTKVLQKKQRSKAHFKPVRDFFSSNNQVVFKCKIGGMIKGITDSLDSILLQKAILLNLPQGNIHTSESNLRGEIHSRPSFVVIGREPEKNQIVELLTKDDDDDESGHGTVKVITIVGMGGLGKTTLAQLVYNDQRVQDHFESSTMWKVVGAEFDPKKIMKSVLELATRKPVQISEIDLVMQELETALSGKRFLLVLDDVWNEDQEQWGVVKAAMTCGARGSKILVTTRSQQVSSIMGSSNSTHQMQQLSLNDCLSLFQQFAFGDEAADQKLMEIGEKIVEKCGGVPLAAISLGSMLRSNRDETYWSSVSNSEIWQLGDEEQKVLAVLKWSYDTLPLPSKKCFAFGSLFPKNYTMRKDELIKLWIANGFLHSERNFDAETEGNRVFNDLVLRSFFLLSFQDEKIRCAMHDLMHDLARSVSAGAYWNSNPDSVEDIGKRTYHLQIVEGQLPIDMFSQVLSKKPSYLRTFLSQDTFSLLNINLLEVFSKLKFLRVLDLRSNKIKKVPASIGNLIHLRYLNLSWNDIEVLPDSMTLLLNLQYLYCDNLRLTYMPRGLSRLINLRCLTFFVADNRSGACSITELEDLQLHGEMTIKFSKNFSDYSCGGRKILKNKHLSNLSLQFNSSENNDRDMLDDVCPNTSLKKLTIINYGSRQFPTWSMELQLPYLVEVRLINCRGCDHIPPFGNLQFLKKLEIVMHNDDNFTQMGAEFHGHGGFPSLQELCLTQMNNLEEWSESQGVDRLFPLLHKLRILRCPKLKCMPRLPRIQELEISYCNESLLSCIGRLTSLSVLRVDDMKDTTSFPSGCIRNLTSLTKLKITECKQLQHLPGDEMQHLETIRSLTIYSCNNLASFPSEVKRLSSLRLTRSQRITVRPEILVPILNSLGKFRIEICGKKVDLRGQLQRLHTLRELLISGKHGTFFFYSKTTQLGICCCDELGSLMTTEPAASSGVLEDLYINEFSNLTRLPEWLQHLKSLRILSIRNCPVLERLPRALKDLPILRDLRIINCPRQEGRCQRVTGEDWPIISHVPHIITVSKIP